MYNMPIVPVKATDTYEAETYRFSPADGQVEQYGYVRNGNNGEAEWIKLGLVTLMRGTWLSQSPMVLALATLTVFLNSINVI